MMAVGYDDQTIRLFKYPCYIPKQVHKTFYGHSSHVTKIKFTAENMVSIGGLDRTIIVWDIDGI
jgi:WD40 repeat protein